jgi:hypothetical protein
MHVPASAPVSPQIEGAPTCGISKVKKNGVYVCMRTEHSSGRYTCSVDVDRRRIDRVQHAILETSTSVRRRIDRVFAKRRRLALSVLSARPMLDRSKLAAKSAKTLLTELTKK